MKIIGAGSGDQLVCTLTKTEVANILGFTYPHEAVGDARQSLIVPGAEIKVSEIFASTMAVRKLHGLLDYKLSGMKAALDSAAEAAKNISDSVILPPADPAQVK